MDNKIELSEWEILFLKYMFVKLENGVMSDEGGSQKIEFKKIDIKPYLLNPGEKYKDSFLNQKIELHFEGYYRHIVITRYGNVPGPMTVSIGADTYGIYEQELKDGLKKVKLFRSFNDKMSSIEAIPNYISPNAEEFILLTRLSNVHGVEQNPEYTAYITCSVKDLNLVAPDIDRYYNSDEIKQSHEVSSKKYDYLLKQAIVHNYKDVDGYQQEGFFMQTAIPFLLQVFNAVEAYYGDSIINHKIDAISEKYNQEISVVNEARDKEISSINATRDEKLSELSEQRKILKIAKVNNKRKK